MHIPPQSAFHRFDPAALNQLNDEFPFLAGAVTDHMLGEDWQRVAIDPRSRALAVVAAAAALGNRTQLKLHAAQALNAGVGQEALKEIVYLTAVHAGFARAIDAAQSLSELFAQRWEKGER
jgi:4-carboxymuconolactone decarboxylase